LITLEGDDCRITGSEKSFDVSSVRLRSSGTSSMARLQSIKLTITVRTKFPRIEGGPKTSWYLYLDWPNDSTV